MQIKRTLTQFALVLTGVANDALSSNAAFQETKVRLKFTDKEDEIMKKWIALLLIAALPLTMLSCNASNKAKGGAIGAAAGGVIGGVLGDKAGNTIMGAIIGAAIGGAAGAYIGQYMDEQAKELDEDLENATVTRVGEGIRINFDSGILFDVDKSELRPAAKQNLQEMAGTLKKYEKTNIIIEGHTDATGPENYNYQLSERRAKAVEAYLASQGVPSSRFTVVGYGESQPVASNETEEGRQKNRRVDVAIIANEELKEIAKQKAESTG